MGDESNAYRWAVAVTPPTDVPLFGELAAFAAKYNAPAAIQMELLFSPAFPMEPPFVRVIRPRFAFHTGHVTVGGSICIELLTSSGWSPAYTLECSCSSARSSSRVRRGSTRRSPTGPMVSRRRAMLSAAWRRSTGGRCEPMIGQACGTCTHLQRSLQPTRIL